jgi:hypothetical protein
MVFCTRVDFALYKRCRAAAMQLVQQNTGVPIGVGVCASSELISGFLLLVCYLSTGVTVLQV